MTLRRGRVALRPVTEGDWELLHRWWSDRVVSYYADANEGASSYTIEQVSDIVRSISAKAFCFVIEHDGFPIGDCWLQEMNLKRILDSHAGRDCRRIDLEIGEKGLWDRGIGTRTIRLLAEFGFRRQNADAIFACEIGDYNPRSLRPFSKAGFEPYGKLPRTRWHSPGWDHDMVLTLERFERAEGATSRGCICPSA